MKNDNKALANQFLDLSWRKGNLQQLKDISTDNFYYQTTFTDDILSLEQYFDYIVTFRTSMPDIMLHIEETMSEGNRVMTHISFSGTVKEAFYGIPATDNIIAFTAVSLWDIKNGKVASLNSLIDIRGIEDQLKTRLSKPPIMV